MSDSYVRVEVRSRAELRKWLEKNHAKSPGCWVVTFKKTSGEPRVDNGEVGAEALCFGWVDSRVAKVDARRSALLITPRKPKSAWSRVNKERVERLIAEGLMTKAGLAVIELAKKSGTWNALDKVENLELPSDLVKRFRAAPPAARKNFDAFPRSVKRAILEWIHSAKKPETRDKRVAETVTLAAKNVRANQWRQP